MKFSVRLLLIPLSVALASALPHRRTGEMSPEKFYRGISSDFPDLQFSESQCTSTSGKTGLCTGYPQCEGHGAVRGGSCSGGFGTCCVYSSGFSTSKDQSWPILGSFGSIFVNPDYPLPTLMSEASMRRHIEPPVCQIRLHLDSLDLPEGTVFRTSVNGYSDGPDLIGNNTGQHLILDVKRRTSSVHRAWIRVSISGPSAPKTWRVRLEAIACGSPTVAPDGCRQYFLQESGRVRSLIVSPEKSTSYVACIRPKEAWQNLLSLRFFATSAACDSNMLPPFGATQSGQELPSKICPHDEIRSTYKVTGPILFFITASSHIGVDMEYEL